MDVGTITNRFPQDLLLIDTRLPISLLNSGSYLAAAIVRLALIASASVLILATAPFLFAVLYLAQRFYLRTSKSMRLFDLLAKAPLCSHFPDALKGLATIRGFGWTEKLRADNDILLDTSQRPYYLTYCIQRDWLTCVLDLVVAGLAVTVMGLAVAFRHRGSAPTFGLALLNLRSPGSTLEAVVTEYTQLETSNGPDARIKNFSDTTPREATTTS
ncbi:hypothetical protein AAFC00_001609 [Neodothiora populina]|uniref:ABC transmembrane type-1 domain-containing protein n=1 Tax=Neodothiora populina TaxID=2781224 RepID=A0ABR3PPG4_9PEZI